MLNYIKAELYRNFNRKYLWLYTGIFAVLSVALNIIANVGGSGLSNAIGFTVNMLPGAVFLLLPIIDMTAAEEHKNRTMKNVISYGTPREEIVLSKLIVSVILCFVWSGIILISFYTSGALLFGIGKGAISTGLLKILVSLPLFIGALSFGIFLALVISNNSIFSFIYVMIFLLVKGIINVLMLIDNYRFMKMLKPIYNALITVQLGSLKGNLTSAVVSKAVVSGILYTTVFLILGIAYFRRKEIK